MAPNRYTELFFLDEATALAAGHRPCYECRRARFVAFRAAWANGSVSPLDPAEIRVATIDTQLHAERTKPDRSQQGPMANIDELPDGTFLKLRGDAWLIWQSRLHMWSPGAYCKRVRRPSDMSVHVLTPHSTVAALRAGYVPQVHSSASRP